MCSCRVTVKDEKLAGWLEVEITPIQHQNSSGEISILLCLASEFLKIFNYFCHIYEEICKFWKFLSRNKPKQNLAPS